MHRQSMIPGRTAFIAALAAALLFAGCAQYAAVAEKRPRFMPNPVGLGVLQGAEKAITNALRRDRREPIAALGEYLTAAETAAQQLRYDPERTSSNGRVARCSSKAANSPATSISRFRAA